MGKIWNSLDNGMKKLITIFGIVFIIFIVFMVILSIVGSNKKMNYQSLENLIEKAAKSYVEKQDKLPSKDKNIIIDSNDLIALEYMKPWEKYTDDYCTATVIVENNNDVYNYITLLDCADYKTKTLKDVIKEDLVISDNGLYEDGNGNYLYKGEYPNNYVMIDEILYRIVSMDSETIKLIYSGDRDYSSIFDDRYNETTKTKIGINDYSKSRLKEKINNFYNNSSDVLKKYILNTSWCLEKYSKKTGQFNCDNYYEDYMAVLSIQDFIKPSLDNNCKLGSKSCDNYNYLAKFANYSYSITVSSDNTYEVYLLSSVAYEEETNQSNDYYPIFNININNVYISGDGTENNPFIIK